VCEVVGVTGAFLVGGANEAVAVIFVKTLGMFYGDDAQQMREDSHLWASIMIGVALCQIVGDTMRYWGFSVPGERITMRLKEMYYSGIMRQEIGWHDMPDNSSGKLCADLASEVGLIQALVGEAMGLQVLFLTTAISCFSLAFYFGNWKIALVGMSMVPILMSSMAVEMAMMSGIDKKKSSGLGSEAGQIIGEVVPSVRTVAAFTLEGPFREKFDLTTDKCVVRLCVASCFCKFSSGIIHVDSRSILSQLIDWLLLFVLLLVFWICSMSRMVAHVMY
jgi:ATP-binding cassette subfamily B (MDR/TAP) protein 1